MGPVLVVGATGQLGTAVVERLAKAKRRVRALVRPASPREFDAEGVEPTSAEEFLRARAALPPEA